jgi:methionyl-tRNA formyltransferase
MDALTLLLMNQKGLAVLSSLVKKLGASAISKVITARDSSVEKDFVDEIAACCKKNGIACHLRNEKYKIETSYALAIGWRWLIKEKPKKNLIVLHDSLLPKNRGFNPLVTALINGDDRIGVTAIYSSTRYDEGPILGQVAFPIQYPCKISKAIELIIRGYVELSEKICTKIIAGKIMKSTLQDESKATYSLWRDEEDYRINWNSSSVAIKRFVDAVGLPYSGATTVIDESFIRIHEVSIMQDRKIENRSVGKVIYMEDNCPVVVCGEGLLRIDAMSANDGNSYTLKKFRSRFK